MPETILVTGASAFIGGWVVKLLLDKGYNVRGTVRSSAKEAQVLDAIPKEQHSQVSFAHIGDIATDSFDEAVQGVDGIIHVASPFHFKVEDPEKDLLLPAINGTLGVLKSAHKYNQSNQNKIKRIVITSSFASILDPSKGSRPGYAYTEKDWCPITYEQGAAAKNDPVTAYRASKVCAERAAWDFVEKEKPSFTIATICEPMVYGPRTGGFHSLDEINTSNAALWALVTSGKDAKIPDTRTPLWVDVRDVAYTHVAGLEAATNTNERYLIAANSWSNQKVADIVHESKVIPQSIKDSTPVGTKGQQLPDHYTIDSSKAQEKLGTTYIPLKKTIEDLILQLVELQQKSTK
ncbi:unnamed protein product [Didymodactylos carnosus]|uniref:NAD-dependent epimerase/dehydratase domain-containing protein n=1 Tax=Didymodactylos carnosus TaxID=1234261 RepID=A0A814K6J7_9BILA|nr:unnamed protein product [Didymodactylos carnosus]CAF3817100.1 unnamed protein product [Didymodactylos carnosus]